MGKWQGNVWECEFIWRREWFSWELPMVEDFVNFVSNRRRYRGEVNKWIWKVESSGSYTVKYAYLAFRNTLPNAKKI